MAALPGNGHLDYVRVLTALHGMLLPVVIPLESVNRLPTLCSASPSMVLSNVPW